MSRRITAVAERKMSPSERRQYWAKRLSERERFAEQGPTLEQHSRYLKRLHRA